MIDLDEIEKQITYGPFHASSFPALREMVAELRRWRALGAELTEAGRNAPDSEAWLKLREMVE
jgi:hypothetical protein